MLPKKPDILAHYTNIDGALGILGRKEIWASNIMYLNDKEELIHALKSIEKPLKEILELVENKSVVHSAIDSISNKISINNIPDTYATSFCLNEDKLSMWRGYSHKSQGVSISFKYDYISKISKNKNINSNKVIYSKFSTERELQKQIKSQIRSFIDIEEIIGNSGSYLRNHIESSIYLILARFKHIGFKDEGEWRLITQDKDGKIRPQFRPHGNRIIPYITLPLENISTGIKKITVGPGNDQELTAKSIKKFMKHNDLNEDIVKISMIPYRD